MYRASGPNYNSYDENTAPGITLHQTGPGGGGGGGGVPALTDVGLAVFVFALMMLGSVTLRRRRRTLS